MKTLLAFLTLVASPVLLAQSHEEHVHAPATASMHDMAAMETTDPLMDSARQMAAAMHGGSSNWLLMTDRFEYLDMDGRNALQWEAQGWYGGDINKFRVKTEGEYDTDSSSVDEAEVQLLFSHAVAPFWDIQAGVRHDEGSAVSRTYAVLGATGLAPYWFEVDAAAFASEEGKLSARLEAEYELRFTQRLILQPRLELNYAFADDAEASMWQGMSESSIGLRLRYEVLREFAPYVGVEWWRAYGKSGTQLESVGKDSSEARVVAGLRVWF